MKTPFDNALTDKVISAKRNSVINDNISKFPKIENKVNKSHSNNQDKVTIKTQTNLHAHPNIERSVNSYQLKSRNDLSKIKKRQSLKQETTSTNYQNTMADSKNVTYSSLYKNTFHFYNNVSSKRNSIQNSSFNYIQPKENMSRVITENNNKSHMVTSNTHLSTYGNNNTDGNSQFLVNEKAILFGISKPALKYLDNPLDRPIKARKRISFGSPVLRLNRELPVFNNSANIFRNKAEFNFYRKTKNENFMDLDEKFNEDEDKEKEKENLILEQENVYKNEIILLELRNNTNKISNKTVSSFLPSTATNTNTNYNTESTQPIKTENSKFILKTKQDEEIENTKPESLEDYYRRISKYIGLNNIKIKRPKRKHSTIIQSLERNHSLVVSELNYDDKDAQNTNDNKDIPELHEIGLFSNKNPNSPLKRFSQSNLLEIESVFLFDTRNSIRSKSLKKSLNPKFSMKDEANSITNSHKESPNLPNFKKARSSMCINPDDQINSPFSLPKSFFDVNRNEFASSIEKVIQLIPTESDSNLFVKKNSKANLKNKKTLNLNSSENCEDLLYSNTEPFADDKNLFVESKPNTAAAVKSNSKNKDYNFYKTKHLETPSRASKISHKIKQKIHDGTSLRRINSPKIDENPFTEYDRDLIYKMKILEEFLQEQKRSNFISPKFRYRKIFVVVDGLTILKCLYIPGKFIEIPTKSLLITLKSKKERLEKFYEFLNAVNKTYKHNNNFKNLFTMNGNRIFDLIDIPENHRAVFVSINANFRGLHLFFKERPILIKNDLQQKPTRREKYVLKKEDRKLLDFEVVNKKTLGGKKLRFKRKIIKTENKLSKQLTEKTDYKFYNPRKTKNRNNSFSQSDNTDYDFVYYSDNETKKKDRHIMLKQKFPRKCDLIFYFDKFCFKKKQIDVNNKYFKKINERKLISEDPIKLLDEYNCKDTSNKEKKEEDDPGHIATRFMKAFMERLNIIKVKDNSLTNDLDQFALDQGEKISTKFIKKNKKLVENIYFQVHRGVEKFYPSLFSMNIPKLLNNFPKLKRKDFYEIFIQYKMLLKICIALNKSMDILKRGIDFDTFYHTVPQVKQQGVYLAKKIFETINERNNNYLDWDEFVKGMMTFKSKDISEKIDMFFKIIDTDGNGLLAFDEVKELSKISLNRGIEGSANEEVIDELSDYFANLIFKLVDIPTDTEIPLRKIRNKIILRGKEASYLEMFVGAGADDEVNILDFL